eukprot:14750560-Alexandrium_andersonii.AAC.1
MVLCRLRDIAGRHGRGLATDRRVGGASSRTRGAGRGANGASPGVLLRLGRRAKARRDEPRRVN